MTTLHAAWAPMDAPTLDEKMEVASSPFHEAEVEDIDLEIEPAENHNLLPPSDNPMDDASIYSVQVEDAMQGDGTEVLEDQDMEDDGQGELQAVENELDMVEDAVDDQDRDDDIIYDTEEEPAAATEPQVQGENSHLEAPEQQDEDLFDFDDTDNADTSAAQPTLDQTATTEAHEPADGEGHQAIEPDPSDPPAPNHNVEPANVLPAVNEETVQGQEVPLQSAAELQEPDQHPPVKDNPAEAQEEAAHDHTNNRDNSSPVDNEVLPGLESLADVEINALGPHFVTLTYKNVQYPLFSDGEASDDEPFPLSDTNILFEPLEKLLEACKQRVFTEDQDHLDEVVLTIPAFAMRYSQDSKFSSEHSLWDILRLYVKLKLNEGAKSLEPLNCSLSVQTCLDTQFRWLISEAHKQLAYSDLNADYVGIGNAFSETIGHVHELSVDDVDSLEGEEPREEHGDGSHGEPQPTELEADTHEDAEGPSDEKADAPRDTEAEYVKSPDLAADDPAATEVVQAQIDPPVVVEAAATQEQQAEQSSEFFEEAYEDEQAADEIEDQEEQIEHNEDEDALEQAAAANDQALEGGDQSLVGEIEQTDLSGEPQPFKIVEEVEEIALEEQDLIIRPEEPLGADEDPDALLEARTSDTVAADSEDVKTNGGHEATPTTPRNFKLAKRKAEEDEDDVIELDFDTPPPKRLRASPP